MSTPRDLFPDLYPNAKPTKATAPSATDSTASSNSKAKASPMQKLWCETQWTTLSFQAKKLGLSTLPYFDPKTMLLSREVNVTMWKQLEKLFNALGPEKAGFATPEMLEGGEVIWHSFLGEDKGQKADFYENKIDSWW